MVFVWSIVGLAVGSVLNALIVSLPRREPPFAWLSRCRCCDASLPVTHVSTLFGYVFHGGRCKFCGQPFALSSLLVELANCVLFGALYLRFGLTLPLFVYSLYISVLIVIFMIDLQHRLILNVVTYPSIVLAVLLTFVVPGLGGGKGLLGGLFYGGLFLAFYIAAVLIYKGEALGLGDVKLALLIGLITGLRGAAIAAILGTAIGSLMGLWLIVFRRTSSKATMPYGPALSLGAMAAILWSPWIN